MNISGKVAIVTGGAGGIGKAMIEILLQKQAKVVYLVDINDSESKKVQEELHQKYGDDKVRLYRGDVSSFEQMEVCFKKVKSECGAIHIVCNNAGYFNEINWQRSLEINLNGVVIGTKLAVEYMDGASAGGGVIVNTASIAGLALLPFGPMYATAKCAVIGFTRQTANFDPVVKKKNLRVNVLCPPCVDTPIVYQDKAHTVEERYQKYDKEVFDKMKPYMTPDDLVQQFVKLIEEPHNGQAMLVVSGQHSEFPEDHTKAFREENGLQNIWVDVVTKAANNE